MSFAERNRSSYTRSSEMSSMLGKNAEIQSVVQSLSKRNQKLERMCAKLGTRGDSPEDRTKMRQEREEFMKLVKQAVQAMKENTNGDRQVMDKLRRQFDSEVQRFKEICEVMEEKEKAMMAALTAEDDERTPLTGGVPSDRPRQMQDQKQYEIDPEFVRYQETDVASRHAKVMQIERDTQEILEVYKDLKTLVEVQQENIDVIDNNIQDTKLKTQGGLVQLQEAEESQKKSRKRKCCIVFAVMTLLVVIVVIFMFLKPS